MPKVSVLIVDDDPSLRRSVGEYFEHQGYTVYRASSGEEGVRIYDRSSPDVTLLDLVMPGKSGLEVLAELRARQATVIMLTGVSEIEVAVQAMRAGAENFLTKPIDMVHLAAAVDNAAEKALLRREVLTLRRRIEPGFRRRALRWAFFTVLLALSVTLGMAIGGLQVDRPQHEIPVPLDTTPG